MVVIIFTGLSVLNYPLCLTGFSRIDRVDWDGVPRSAGESIER